MTPDPLVSVILTTRDRPRLLSISLACYRHQSYAKRELVVVDDGERYPVDEAAVAAAGGRLVRVVPGTPLGTKLNRGVEAARGILCQKMDDDDWYASNFLETQVATVLESWNVVCRPTLAFVTPFLFFDIARWQIHRSIQNNVPGATFLFSRDTWEERPFRALPRDEDVWFFLDRRKLDVALVPVPHPDIFLAVRHRGSSLDRGHTWTHQGDGRILEDYIESRPLHHQLPESLLPDWALSAYRDLHGELARGPGGSVQIATALSGN